MGRWISILLLVASGCVGGPPGPARSPAVETVEAVARESPELRTRLSTPSLFERAGEAFVTHPGPRALGTTLPALASEPWQLAHGDGGRVAMAARLLRVMPVAGQLVDGAVVYPAIHTSTDAVVRANADQVELFYVLHDAAAPRSWRWETMPEDGTWRASDSGAELVDGTGHVRFHATRPIAFDRDGTVLAMSMHVEGDALRYELVGASDVEWPVVVDPGFDIAYWEQRHDAFPLPLVAPPSSTTRRTLRRCSTAGPTR